MAPVTPLLQSFVPYAVAPEEQDHYDDVHDEEHGDDEIAEVAVKILYIREKHIRQKTIFPR